MDLSIIFIIQIVVALLFCFLAAYYDLKFGIIPNKLNLFLIIFGLLSNLFLSLISTNIKFILGSIIFMVFAFVITLMMWKLNIWGGGDVKLFVAITTVIPFGLDIPFLHINPIFSFYPFFLTVIINSILVAFPFLLCYILYVFYKNIRYLNDNKLFIALLNINVLSMFIKNTFNKFIPIKNLKEGMIVNNYYFNGQDLYESFKMVDGNIRVYINKKDLPYDYYFKTDSAGGLTASDVAFLKILNLNGQLKNYVSIKVSFPFAPAIAIGFLISIYFGDIIMVLIKNLTFVI